jgi:transcriptional regulator with XRE-family HTH domain
MSSKYSHDQVLQSIQPFRKKYKAISLSTSITMELEELMEHKGISKKELAAAAGVSPSYLSQVFSGDKLINISMLAGISNEFNVVFRMEIQDKKSEEFLDKASRMTVAPELTKTSYMHKFHPTGNIKPYYAFAIGADCGD